MDDPGRRSCELSATGAPAAAPPGRRWATPTGEPCPRSVLIDRTVVGSGDCHGCGCCLLFGGLIEPAGGPPDADGLSR